jgi:KDO2-lipid IV(A) lauroyltransferase
LDKIYHILLTILTKIPFWVLYILSDVFFFLNYYFIGYRRTTIKNNLKNSFPDKSKKELRKIEKEFYRNFSDYMVETIKLFDLNKKALEKIHTHENQEVLHESKRNKKNVILLAGHFFNWEYYVGTGNELPQDYLFAVYKHVSNPFWNNKITELRQRFRTNAVEYHQAPRHILNQPNDGNSIYLFISDQSPFKEDIHYTLTFLNQETPVFNGFDKIARKKNYDVIFLDTKKVKRNHYHTKFVKINPKKEVFEENEITTTFFKMVEENIKRQPSNWLWSHKRWKYKNGKDFHVKH